MAAPAKKAPPPPAAPAVPVAQKPKPRPMPMPERPSPKDEERMIRQQRDAEMDRKMQEAYKRFQRSPENDSPGFKKGGKIKKYSGGSASKRADGCAVKGKTRGKFV